MNLRVVTVAAAMVLVAAKGHAQTPTIAYEVTVDTARRGTYSVTMYVRGVSDTFQIAMVKHAEYDDRPWRFVQNLALNGADDGDRITRLDSALWRVNIKGGDAVISYTMSVPGYLQQRSAYRPFLSPTGGLIGDVHTFMYVVGHTNVPAHVKLNIPDDWQIATQLLATSDPRTFFAPTADALMDAPILLGHLRQWRFVTDHAPYRIAYWSAPSAAAFDSTSLVQNIIKLTGLTADLFGGVPWPEYTFLLQDGANAALEHSASVTIGAPARTVALDSWELMPSIAHEFFHSWNLVRIKPAEEHGIDYRGQPPVASLWFGEGVTMYYADVLLRRGGFRMNEVTRREHLENLIESYLSDPGNAKFSAEQVSRVANATVPAPLGDYGASTHVQGELLGTMLDLIIRDATDDRRSMDDVMRAMYKQSANGRGFLNADLERTIEAICGCDVTPFFNTYVRGAAPLDINRYLKLAGLTATITNVARVREDQPLPDLRIRAWIPPGRDSMPEIIIWNPSSAWARAGLHSGDRLVSLGDRPMQAIAEIRAFINARKIGETVPVEVMRGGQRRRVTVQITGYSDPSVRLSELQNASAKQRAIRERWMKAEP